MEKTKTVTAYIGVESLKSTNPNLDEKNVQRWQTLIKSGGTLPALFVRLIPGEGYYVNNGNHRLEAAERERVKVIKSDIYNIGQE